MAKGLDTEQLRQRLAQVRRDQDELLDLPEAEFRKVCWDIAAMRRDPFLGCSSGCAWRARPASSSEWTHGSPLFAAPSRWWSTSSTASS